MPTVKFQDSVFINCPFDPEYWPLLEVMVFTVLACGFVPRSALEEADGTDVRFEKIVRLIGGSRYGIHDISRVSLDPINHLPRFNMPFELGLDIACKKYGTSQQKQKSVLILEQVRFTYQRCLSDIAGQDTRPHDNDPAVLIGVVRDWLKTASRRTKVPGPTIIRDHYALFADALPDLCANGGLDRSNLQYVDYVELAQTWLEASS